MVVSWILLTLIYLFIASVLGGVLVESIGYGWLATAVSASFIIMASSVFRIADQTD